MITISSEGKFDRSLNFLDKLLKGDIYRNLERYGQMGVDALASNTPKDSGITAGSWGYRIGKEDGGYSIEWYNTSSNKGVNIAIIIQYGHGTGTGGYVTGIDYINPALRPVFDKIADEVWKEVTRS